MTSRVVMMVSAERGHGFGCEEHEHDVIIALALARATSPPHCSLTEIKRGRRMMLVGAILSSLSMVRPGICDVIARRLQCGTVDY